MTSYLFFLSVRAITGFNIQQHRINYIQNFNFPEYIVKRFQNENNVKDEDLPIIIEAFKSYLMIFTGRKKNFCPMPSTIVDELWHTFLLFSKEYTFFCKKAFGFYLHHTPNESVFARAGNSDNTYNELVSLHNEYKCFESLKFLNTNDSYYSTLFEIDNLFSHKHGAI